MEAVTPFPLKWPAGRPRRPAGSRKSAKFNRKVDTGRGWSRSIDLTVADALSRLQDELDRMGARYAVVSSNLETRLDGLPRSGQREPDDPGVALYFHLAGKPHCMPCDTYERVADNIAAIAAHMAATRLIERHGVASVAEMFAGFTSLPAPEQWWDVLGVPHTATRAQIEAAYRRKAKECHPDAGGSSAAMARVNAARDSALA